MLNVDIAPVEASAEGGVTCVCVHCRAAAADHGGVAAFQLLGLQRYSMMESYRERV